MTKTINKQKQSTNEWKVAAQFLEKHFQLEVQQLKHNHAFQSLDDSIKQKVKTLFTHKKLNHTILDQPATTLINNILNHDLSGQSIDDYQLIELIAHGGMSSVYRARRTDIKRQKDVAIKLIPASLQTKETTSLFKNDLEILAKLHHPNIISMHLGGVSQSGSPYLVMELIENALQIDQYFKQQELSFSAIIKHFITLCDVIDYAH